MSNRSGRSAEKRNNSDEKYKVDKDAFVNPAKIPVKKKLKSNNNPREEEQTKDQLDEQRNVNDDCVLPSDDDNNLKEMDCNDPEDLRRSTKTDDVQRDEDHYTQNKTDIDKHSVHRTSLTLPDVDTTTSTDNRNEQIIDECKVNVLSSVSNTEQPNQTLIDVDATYRSVANLQGQVMNTENSKEVIIQYTNLVDENGKILGVMHTTHNINPPQNTNVDEIFQQPVKLHELRAKRKRKILQCLAIATEVILCLQYIYIHIINSVSKFC